MNNKKFGTIAKYSNILFQYSITDRIQPILAKNQGKIAHNAHINKVI